jgi:HlyD family secretion protein
MQNLRTGTRAQRWPLRPLLGVLAVTLLGTAAYALWQSRTAPPPPSAAAPAKLPTVTALGYLEPQGKVVKLSAPSGGGGTSRVEQLLVKPGDPVRTGQVIAVLDSRDRLQSDLQAAQQQVKVAQANLAVVKAGAKQGEVNAQQAEIGRLQAQRQGEAAVQQAALARFEAELNNAQVEAQRYESLYQQGAVSASLRDSKALALATAGQSLQEAQASLSRIQTARAPELRSAQATLERIAEVRPVDIAAAQAQVDQALAAVDQAQAQLDLATVRSPQNGVVLEIHTRPGELIASNGIVELGRTREMMALLEVYETDIAKVKVGQPTQLFADSLPSGLSGEVAEVGVQVKRQNVVNSDTSANIDARVVEVRVRLDAASAQKVAGLTNLQVTGEIQQ